MRCKILSLATKAFLAASLISHALASHAQEIQLEKILNPMADYDPFESPGVTAPKFFPDDVDRRARELLIDALTNRKAELADHVQFFKSEDVRLQRQRDASTGLSEHAQDLLNNTLQDRERY
ncbi:MAG TPA: hypothetical protein VKH62_12385, partial [Candidatus Binatia bacterium]|nr:hypothetical protein [Candidatus Binatia bacterium]